MSSTHANPATSSTLIFLSILLLSFATKTKSDNPPCPYPCYPPPTGVVTPTTPSAGGGSTVPPAPPQPVLTYPPPSGSYPYYPTPPYGGEGDYNGNGGGVSGTPPPPDPILPYFPFYYKKPPHKPEDNSAPTSLKKRKEMVFITSFLSLLLLFV
ncbi:leucine-rich repeat extensin-like protein 5 [Vigna unguiculata]|uniref:Uncharacterized protein n=1 Tax=Vigna unguiculata TaxID=3917 RepID=A0A4D6L3F4_VIGUN|nr:leucine-rich repeat extensin-like protein 5 [Vigna unguiculata]QCD82974.1 hypothetical protein DEO72_LG2g3316 [Vigna unguiculata]